MPNVKAAQTLGIRLAVSIPALVAGLTISACGDLDIVNTNAPTVMIAEQGADFIRRGAR
jgi:hypothetical protein